jgi:glycosyltransferase involved in cell wall biosynthesis
MTAEKSFISIIIPVYNGEKTIGRCLKSISNSSYPHFECIVVDDCSSDRTVEIARTFDVNLIEMSLKKNAAQARNVGAKAAKGEVLLFMDSDVEIFPNSLSDIAEVFQKKAEITALFGSYDDEPGESDFFSQYRNLLHHYIHQTSRADAGTFWTAFGAVKRDAFLDVGGFNEGVRMMEDIDLGYRMSDRGHKIRLEKDLKVKHLKAFSLSKMVKADIFDRAVPWTSLMLERKRFTGDLNLKPRHRLSAITLIFLIISIFLGLFNVRIFIAAPILMGIYLFLNADFYRFFMKKRGFLFALKVIPFHALYYLYSMFGLLIGICLHLLRKYRIIK